MEGWNREATCYPTRRLFQCRTATWSGRNITDTKLLIYGLLQKVGASAQDAIGTKSRVAACVSLIVSAWNSRWSQRKNGRRLSMFRGITLTTTERQHMARGLAGPGRLEPSGLGLDHLRLMDAGVAGLLRLLQVGRRRPHRPRTWESGSVRRSPPCQACGSRPDTKIPLPTLLPHTSPPLSFYNSRQEDGYLWRRGLLGRALSQSSCRVDYRLNVNLENACWVCELSSYVRMLGHDAIGRLPASYAVAPMGMPKRTARVA